VKGLDFGKTFAPIAHLDAIRILLAFAASKEFKLYQMDVKIDFLNVKSDTRRSRTGPYPTIETCLVHASFLNVKSDTTRSRMGPYSTVEPCVVHAS
jgi:hypothetical protein